MTTMAKIQDDQFQAWMYQINEACGSFDGRLLDREFSGSLTKRQIGEVSLSVVDMAQVNLFRGKKEILASDTDHFYAVFQLSGHSHLEQSNNRVELGQGDITFIDARLPLNMHFHGSACQLSLILPRASIESDPRIAPIECARRIDAQTPLAKLANQLIIQTTQMDNLSTCESEAILNSVISLLRPALALESKGGGHDRIFQKALALIDHNITSEELSPEKIANEVGISMRSLYRIFSKKGLVIAQYIRNRRLDFCAESLRNAPLDQKLSTFGYTWGFSDSSYFSTAFKNRFGISPGEYRKRYLK